MFIPHTGIIPNETQVPFKLRHVQFPVRLCFAMTINKSQGQSVNHVGMMQDLLCLPMGNSMLLFQE